MTFGVWQRSDLSMRPSDVNQARSPDLTLIKSDLCVFISIWWRSAAVWTLLSLQSLCCWDEGGVLFVVILTRQSVLYTVNSVCVSWEGAAFNLYGLG